MTRAKSSVARQKRHRKILKQAEGDWGGRHRMFKVAKEAVTRAMAEAFGWRKQRKRDARKLWVMRLNAAARANGLRYAELIRGLEKAGVELNRKMLAELAATDPEAFAKVAEMAKEQLEVRTAEE